MNYKAVKTFAQKIFIALLLVSFGKILIAGRCAILGLPLVFIGDYRMVAAVVSLLGEDFFGSFRLDSILSRVHRFMEDVKEKTDKLEH